MNGQKAEYHMVISNVSQGLSTCRFKHPIGVDFNKPATKNCQNDKDKDWKKKGGTSKMKIRWRASKVWPSQCRLGGSRKSGSISANELGGQKSSGGRVEQRRGERQQNLGILIFWIGLVKVYLLVCCISFSVMHTILWILSCRWGCPLDISNAIYLNALQKS